MDDDRDLSTQLLTTREVAKRLNVSVPRVRQMIDEDKFPGAVKKGGHWFIPASDIERKQSFWRRNGKRIGGAITAILAIVPILLAIVALIPDSSALKLQLIDWGWRAFPAANEDQSLIIVATFDDSGNIRQTEAQVEIKDAIETAREEAGLTDRNTPVEIYPVDISSNIDFVKQLNQAVRIGRRYNASIIIWGSDSGIKVTVNFLDLKQPDFVYACQRYEETNRTQLVNPSAYAQFILEDLPSRLTFLSLFSIGYTYFQGGKYSESLNIIERAIQSIPPEERTIESYNRSIELDPRSPRAYLNRGNTYYSLGKTQNAIDDLDRAIEIDPNYAPAYYNLGVISGDLGDKKRAVAEYGKAIELNQNIPCAYHNRGNAYSSLGDQQSAVADYNKAIAIDPEFSLAYNGRGAAYEILSDHERAIKDYDKAIKLDPNYSIAYYNRGSAYSNLGDYKRAINDYTVAIEIDPKDYLNFFGRGLAFYYLGDYERAIEDYTEAIKLNSEYANVYKNRGIVYVAIGENLMALADYERYLELLPEATDRQVIKDQIEELQEKIDLP
jgi:excisionase family DNA binding protein